jgi:hypothetical protein
VFRIVRYFGARVAAYTSNYSTQVGASFSVNIIPPCAIQNKLRTSTLAYLIGREEDKSFYSTDIGPCRFDSSALTAVPVTSDSVSAAYFDTTVSLTLKMITKLTPSLLRLGANKLEYFPPSLV